METDDLGWTPQEMLEDLQEYASAPNHPYATGAMYRCVEWLMQRAIEEDIDE